MLGSPKLQYLLVLLCGRLEAYGGLYLIYWLQAEIHQRIFDLFQSCFCRTLGGKYNISSSLLIDDKPVFLKKEHSLTQCSPADI